jgi:hypothetical protein
MALPVPRVGDVIVCPLALSEDEMLLQHYNLIRKCDTDISSWTADDLFEKGPTT